MSVQCNLMGSKTVFDGFQMIFFIGAAPLTLNGPLKIFQSWSEYVFIQDL